MSDIEIEIPAAVEFTLECNDCDAELEGSHIDRSGYHTVYVEPCEACQEKAIEKAIFDAMDDICCSECGSKLFGWVDGTNCVHVDTCETCQQNAIEEALKKERA